MADEPTILGRWRALRKAQQAQAEERERVRRLIDRDKPRPPKLKKGRRGKKPSPANDDVPLSDFTAQHGDYQPATVVDLTGELGGRRQSMVRVVKNRTFSLVDKWLAEGGPGFDEPQGRAIDHVRKLWASSGNCGRLVANYGGFGCGGGGRERDTWSQTEALAQLAEYEREIPRTYWIVFERMARDDFSAGEAGKMFAGNDAQRQAHAKNIVGFCASLIAQWRGY